MRRSFGWSRFSAVPDRSRSMLAAANVAVVLLAEADQVDVAFVTVDPDRDTPEIMNGYLGHFVEDGTAVRVTDRERLEGIESAFGASSTVQKSADGVVEVSHTSISYVVDPDGRVVVEWPFGVKSDAMANDLHILLSQLN